jgi:acylaminoacyl-peptidase
MDSGQTALLTNLTETPRDLTWSPDGRWLAFTQFVAARKEPLAKPPEKPERAEWAPPVTVIDSVVYRIDGQGYLKSGFSHIFLVAADGGVARQLTRGDFNHEGRMSFTPDGRRIVFSANRSADWEYEPVESELHALDIDTGMLTQLTNRKGPDRSPQVSPDGRRIAYTGFDDREQGYQVSRLYVVNTDGSNARAITSGFDRDVEDPVWSADGRSLHFAFDEHGIRRVAAVTLDGRVREIARAVGGADVSRPYTDGGFSLARNGRVAFAQISAQRPGDVAVSDGRSVERLGWKSGHDGREIEGWLVRPPNFDASKKYPLILEIHGGPFRAYGPNFSVEIQRYAAAGYIVLYANPRGSTSYGEQFGNLIHHAYPGNDYDDLMSGVDAAIASGSIDADNLFVTGGSGGGVLTAWIVGKTPRFRAAVVAKPVINWTSFVLTADMNNFFYRYWFPGPPWEAQEQYWRRSPLSLVGNVSTPTMVLTGEADYRTPMAETEQYYQALKLRKVPTAMLRIPEASHGMTARPSNFIAKIDNILAWFERYRR